MASSKQVLLLAVVAAVACLASLASATQWVVGDECGWRAKFNTTHWADDKTFTVGDSLMFMYNKEIHTVAQVGKDDFVACNLQGNQLKLRNSGHDVVHLDKPGKMWFICTKHSHCRKGMKLAIDVVDRTVVAPVPAPAPLSFPFPGTAPTLPPFGSPSTTPALPPPPPPFGSPSTPFPPAPPFSSPSTQAPPPPRSAAVRNPVGAAAAAAAAAVVAAAFAF